MMITVTPEKEALILLAREKLFREAHVMMGDRINDGLWTGFDMEGMQQDSEEQLIAAAREYVQATAHMQLHEGLPYKEPVTLTTNWDAK